MKSKRVKDWESNCEDLWVTVELPWTRTVSRVALCAVYLPPPVRHCTLEYFVNSCSAAIEQMADYDVCLVGDFNLGNIDWKCVDGTSNNVGLSSINELLLDFTCVNMLKQCNFITNAAGRILDLVLSTIPLCYVNESVSPLSTVDQHHPPLDIVISFNKEASLPYNLAKASPDFHRADYHPIRYFLKELDWNSLFSGQSGVDGMLEVFYDVIVSAIQQFLPLCKPKNRKVPSWFSRTLIKMLNEKK